MSQTLKLYIPKVLSENKIVLLKGIGTLRINFRAAEFDENFTSLTAPREEIYFVPSNEKKLDPVLIKIVEIIARVEEQEAEDLVSNFMNELRVELSGNGFLTFPNVGWIKQDNWGSLFFEPTAEYISINRFFGLGAVALPEALSKGEREVLDDIRETVSERTEESRLQPQRETSRPWGFIVGAVMLVVMLMAALFFANQWGSSGANEDLIEETIAEASAGPTSSEKRINLSPPSFEKSKDPGELGHRREIGPNFLPQVPVQDLSQDKAQAMLMGCVIIVGAFEDAGNVTRMVDRIDRTQYEPVVIQGARLVKVGLKYSCQEDGGSTLRWAKEEFDAQAWMYKDE